MRLFVQAGSRHPRAIDGVDEAWILLGDTWNDFSYRTLYGLYHQADGAVVRFGSVKILGLNQEKHEVPLPAGELVGGRLPEIFASLGTSLDYYANVAGLGEQGPRFLEAMADITIDADRRAAFAEQEGLRLSLHRDIPNPGEYYDDARATMRAGGALPEANGLAFEFAPGERGEPIGFAFTSPRGVAPVFTSAPSRRTIVLVGANGVGKTRLLSDLAKVAYAPPSEREAVAGHGRFVGSPAFPNIVAVSYSAFDTFSPPILDGDDRAEVIRQLREGTGGRYAYCGMRDVARLLETHGAERTLMDFDRIERFFADRVEQVRLAARMPLLAQALGPVFREDSFARLLPPLPDEPIPLGLSRNQVLLERFLAEDAAAAFHGLSSGHKIVLHMLASMVATLDRRGLALIDEPETHLHPPLLAALMTGMRHVLDRLQAYAIVATHSPVVVQETLAAQVMIVEYGEQGPQVRRPDIQTFGENVGTLTREIFGLHTGATDYRHVLDRMLANHPSVEAIEAELGEPLSSQAVAHVMATLAGRDNAVD